MARTHYPLKCSIPPPTLLQSNPNHRRAMKPSNYRDRWMMNAAGSAQFPGNPRLFPKPQGHGAPSQGLLGALSSCSILAQAPSFSIVANLFFCLLFFLLSTDFIFPSTSPAGQTQPNSTPDFPHTSDPGEIPHMQPPSGRAIFFIWLSNIVGRPLKTAIDTALGLLFCKH